jgi:hypothetical protein
MQIKIIKREGRIRCWWGRDERRQRTKKIYSSNANEYFVFRHRRRHDKRARKNIYFIFFASRVLSLTHFLYDMNETFIFIWKKTQSRVRTMINVAADFFPHLKNESLSF